MTILNWFSRVWQSLRRTFKDGFIPYRIIGTSPVFNDYARDVEKIEAVFSNPALLKVIALQCDLFSLGVPKVYDRNGKEREDDPALERLNSPNYMQSRQQFLWDYMFWKMIGNAYLYMESNEVTRTNAPMQWLEPSKIEWPLQLERFKDKLVLSQARLSEIMNTEIIYRYDDGTKFTFKLARMATITDLSNGVGNWFKGFSRIDALYKIISNSEHALDAKNINIRYTGKFLVSGQTDPKDVSKLPMGKPEQEDIETKVNGEKQVTAVKSMIEIKRFVDDLKVLPLDEAFLSDYYLIGSMYNIPRDVLEAYKSSTFENQEKARAGHVSYTLAPAGEALGAMLAGRWGYENGTLRRRICLSWDHLPFMQVFEKDRAIVKQTISNVWLNMYRGNIPVNEINAYLGVNFTIDEAREKAAREAATGVAGGGKKSQNAGNEKGNPAKVV